MPRFLAGSWGGERFLMGEIPLQRVTPVGAQALDNGASRSYRGTSLIRERPPP